MPTDALSNVEPRATALLLAVIGLLLAASVLFGRATARFPIPIALVFIGIGMIAGSEGLGGIVFEDYGLAFRFGTVALVLILFDGGLNTPMASVRKVLRPAGLLATVGVLGTALLVAVFANAMGFSWPHALLLGAVVSPTDAAAVFAVLRGSGVNLQRRVGTLLEIESGFNDPVAVILTTALTAYLVTPAGVDTATMSLGLGGTIVVELLVGAVAGWGIGRAGRFALTRLGLVTGGLYPVLSLAVAVLAYAVPTLVHGSGFLAVYVAALVLGDGELPWRPGLRRVHDALAWLGQIVMFIVLGMLVFPSRLIEVAAIGTGIGLFLAIVARPLTVFLCLLPFRYRWRERAYLSWVGLRGAVPIVLATVPVLAGAPGGERLFDVVFFIVVVNTLVPGATVPWLTRRLGLESDEPPAPRAVLEIESTMPLEGELLSFYVDEALAVAHVPLVDLPFPDGAAATLIVRGKQLIPPRGHTTLEPGDHVYVLAGREDRAILQLMFGRPEAD